MANCISLTRRQWVSFELKLREPDAAVRKKRKTPAFDYRNFCDCVPLTALRDLVQAEHA